MEVGLDEAGEEEEEEEAWSEEDNWPPLVSSSIRAYGPSMFDAISIVCALFEGHCSNSLKHCLCALLPVPVACCLLPSMRARHQLSLGHPLAWLVAVHDDHCV